MSNSTLNKVHVPNKKKLPLYGPLQIENYEQYLDDESQRFMVTYASPFPYSLKSDNFELLCQVGTGAFGVVLLVKYKLFGSYYAMKVLQKSELVQSHRVKKALNEKKMLQSLNCPFTIYLLYFSQDNSNIYFILPFIYGGELYTRLRKCVKFSENQSKFYAAQVVLALEYLHRCSVIYRDIKLENVLLDHFGYIKLTDFGLAKIVSHRAYTLCGTPDYMAPEVILCQGYTKAIDWWATGVLIYEMSSGRSPFGGGTEECTFGNILHGTYMMPHEFTSDLKNLVERFLQRDVTWRIGNLKQGVDEIKQHPWFEGIDWLDLFNRRVNPPFVPTDVRRITDDTFPEMKHLHDLDIAEEDEFYECFCEF